MTDTSQGEKGEERRGELDDAGLTIREMAGKYQISLRTLRFYEEHGLISPRRYGVERLYSLEDESKLRRVLTGRRLGFTIREIKIIVESRARRDDRADTTLPSLLKPAEVERRLQQLEEQRRSLDCAIDELRRRIACD